METKETLGNRIRQVRRHYGFSQEEFGQRMGISKSSVINYESGKRTPDADFLISLLRHFEIEAEWLMLGTGKIALEKTGSSKQRFPYPIDDNAAQMIDYLRIPAVKLSMMAEFERIKRVFKPLIQEYEENKKKKISEYKEDTA